MACCSLSVSSPDKLQKTHHEQAVLAEIEVSFWKGVMVDRSPRAAIAVAVPRETMSLQITGGAPQYVTEL